MMPIAAQSAPDGCTKLRGGPMNTWAYVAEAELPRPEIAELNALVREMKPSPLSVSAA